MPKQKKKLRPVRLLSILYGATVGLIILSAALTLALIHKEKTNAGQKSPSISLGAMAYNFTDGKAVKRSDPSVKSLKMFLEADAAHEGCTSSAPVYEHVAAYTKDESQIFIKYGCGAADSSMYGIKLDGSWKMLSPTNHFNMFDIPDCQYVGDNNISKEIAPVCVNEITTQAPTYSVR